MAGPSTAMLSASATPTQKTFIPPQPSTSALAPGGPPRTSLDRPDAAGRLLPPAPNGASSASAVSFAPRGSSLNPSSVAPGSFSSELRSQMMPSRAGSRADLYSSLEKLDSRQQQQQHDDATSLGQTLAALRESLNRELKIKEGSENMLEALNAKKAKQAKEQRQRVEAELNSSSQRIKDLRQRIEDAQRSIATPTTPVRSRTEGLFQSTALRSPPTASRSGAGSDAEEPAESPTFALAELLQALEEEGLTPEYYVAKANSLVDLFKRHPTLKYDLVWSVFGLRMQVLLLSPSREVVAAGYRMTRYAMSDLSSLRKIRTLNTDYIVISSLIKDRKADLEREQALKFVRAFLDIKDGVREISRAIVRTIVAIAEQPEDRLRSICIETLAEVLVRDPPLLIASGGLAPLSEALADGAYKAPESLTSAFLFLLDVPQKRKYLRAGYELEVLFTAFTDMFLSTESILKQNAKAIAAALKTWSGLMNLSMYNFRAIRSLIASLLLPSQPIRETVIDLLYSLLRIKSPAWATSFLAGRRLTTYGRVANLKSAPPKGAQPYHEDDGGEQNFVEHYTALLLAIFIRSGLLPTLLRVTQDADSPLLKRKSTLLIGEVQRLSSRLLPPSWGAELQLLPELFAAAARFDDDAHFVATGIVYQISSVSRTLYRSLPSTWTAGGAHHPTSILGGGLEEDHDQPKSTAAVNLDEATFRQLLLDSGVLGHSNYAKWNWEVVLRIIEGPLTSGKRLEEAIKASKFVKRIMNFYRPFKYRFADVKSTRNTQKYVRVGCALMHTLLQSPQGVAYLADSKLLRQIAECLAQCDPTSGLTAHFPLFARDRVADTLSGGYFAMLGVLSGDTKGLQMMERWRMFNMMYHIIDLKQRPDLIKLLLTHFDYSLQGHPRVLLSKALTAGTKDIRIHATNVLRKFTTGPRLASPHGVGDSKWAVQLLVTQLYDPDVEVCATAVKILEKACNSKNHLQYIVECRPALDHLGEIGAPLLLRFLSTSIGYHYLDGLDYISNEMDDWFLGRNDSYVSLIEASLARAFVDNPEEQPSRLSMFDEPEAEADSHIPPHFYRELTRTEEGCKLLRDKGHFDEFAATIRDHGMHCDDRETMTKVKGCMWAVGNVGSMELGAPFLESSDVVEHIIRIAQEHEIMSLRGTAFFVLGMVSRSVHGLEILYEHGWDSNTNALGQSLGFCIPSDLTKFLSVTPWKHEALTSISLPDTQKTEAVQPPAIPSRPRAVSLLGSMPHLAAQYSTSSMSVSSDTSRAQLDSDPTNQRILELFVDLGNSVLSNRARSELLQLKQQKKAAGFRQPHMFRKVMALMESHHYRLGARRMLELFDRGVLRQVVFEEDESEGSDDSDGADADGRYEEDEDEEEEEEDEPAAGRRGGVRIIPEEPEEEDEAERLDGRGERRGGGGGGGGGGGDSSGDEQRTERQRSVSDPAELERSATVRRGTR